MKILFTLSGYALLMAGLILAGSNGAYMYAMGVSFVGAVLAVAGLSEKF